MINKTAMIALAGRPNVGKSTLTNALTGEKISIVTNKPQTTRNRIFGVVNRNETQIILVDTPGFHKARNRLGDYMVKVVNSSVADVDAVALVVEPIAHVGTQEQLLMEKIRSVGVPAVLIVNKVDKLENKEVVLDVIAEYTRQMEFQAVIPISARTGDGVEEVLDELEKFGQEGPQLFPDGMITDQPERQVIAEIIREKMLWNLDKEIPHGTAVEITRFSERDNGIVDVEATIYCEKASHKGIIIGKGGQMLKKISSQARADCERFMGTKVYLQTWIKVKENWRDSDFLIRNFGYRRDQ